MNPYKTTTLTSLMLLAACGAEPTKATSPDQPAAATPATDRKLKLTYFNIDN